MGALLFWLSSFLACDIIRYSYYMQVQLQINFNFGLFAEINSIFPFNFYVMLANRKDNAKLIWDYILVFS